MKLISSQTVKYTFAFWKYIDVVGIWPRPKDNWKWESEQERKVKTFRKVIGSKELWSKASWCCPQFSRRFGIRPRKKERGEHRAAAPTCSSLPSSQVRVMVMLVIRLPDWTSSRSGSLDHGIHASSWWILRKTQNIFRKVSQVWDDDHEVQELYRYTSFDRSAGILIGATKLWGSPPKIPCL